MAFRTLLDLFPAAKREYLEILSETVFKKFENKLVLVHFLAQCAHETGGFKWFQEFGGPKYCAKYDKRKDLGNYQVGDGYKFRGRGLLMLTGRANYKYYGKRLGRDLIKEPDWAATPEGSVATAISYWDNFPSLTSFALIDNIKGVTKIINGGTNGLADRNQYLEKFKNAFIQV